jgi:hypothetical protein
MTFGAGLRDVLDAERVVDRRRVSWLLESETTSGRSPARRDDRSAPAQVSPIGSPPSP